jgi:putative phage-type endonuclease
MDFERIPLPKERIDWLSLRQQGIGSSDAAAACGVDPYLSALDLYLDKVSPVQDNEDNAATYWGKVLEDIVAREYNLRTGHKVQRSHALLRSVAHPHMLANLDRVIVAGSDGPGILECKTAGQFMVREWGPDGSDEVPPQYFLQVQHQLAVTGYQWAALAVLIGGRDYRVYPMRRSEDLIASIVEMTGDVWARVAQREPPEIDFNHPKVLEMVRRLYPGTNGETVRLSLDAEHARREMLEADRAEKEAKAKKDRNKAMILAEMGEAAVGLFEDGTCMRRALVQRAGHTVAPSEFMDARLGKAPKGV